MQTRGGARREAEKAGRATEVVAMSRTGGTRRWASEG